MKPSVIAFGPVDVIHDAVVYGLLTEHFGLATVVNLDSARARFFNQAGELGLTTDQQRAEEMARGLGIECIDAAYSAKMIRVLGGKPAAKKDAEPNAVLHFTSGETEFLTDPERRWAILPSPAETILRNAAAAIEQRAAQRDLQDGERSMARTVAAFNALTGGSLSERDGWLFMAVLKAARATAGAHQLDDYTDGAAYFALAGECAERAA
ncbi:DUF6378 domain-containing protein [Pseudoxanthomonas winnipegensis]|uniref:DUF6378 domain-containing protein n=1 Tax=Pseudoxanthomonas winnipegensis TaxID=2480810 RepID=UPI00197FB6C2|nr:DUF6378 domain-containing protein [Pseudoxanthomonas winnipegensis]